MGTRASIVYYDNEKYNFRYVHMDGYISQLGVKLQEGFQEKELKLLFLKNQSIDCISFISRENFRKKTFFKSIKEYEREMLKTDNVIINDTIVKYWKEAHTSDINGSFKNKQDIYKKCSQEYVYIYENTGWKVSYNNKEFLDLKPLVQIFKKCESIKKLKEKYKNYIYMEQVYERLELKNEEKIQAYKLYIYYEKNKDKKDYLEEIFSTNSLDIKEIKSLHDEHKSFLLYESLDNKLQNKKTNLIKKI